MRENMTQSFWEFEVGTEMNLSMTQLSGKLILWPQAYHIFVRSLNYKCLFRSLDCS